MYLHKKNTFVAHINTSRLCVLGSTFSMDAKDVRGFERVQFDAIVCNSLQYDAIGCNMVQEGASKKGASK